MPQMAPINWLILYASFNVILLIWNNMNFFYKINKPYSSPKMKSKLNNSWSW